MSSAKTALQQPWVVVVGAIVGMLTLLFFMGLILLSVFGREVPCESRYLVITVIAFGAALSTAFLGGAAAAKGSIPILGVREHPLSVSLTGGVAVLVILLIVGAQVFPSDCREEPRVSCADTYQSYFVSQLRFGFCYPREGWELDKGPIDARAADIYVRQAKDHDVGLHFHVSLIPAAYSGKHEEYTRQVVKTWRQLDSSLTTETHFIAGREAYYFSLNVKDRNEISRPTEVVHVYLNSEKLLEIISTRFKETSQQDKDTLAKIRSSLVIEKF